ncbi:cytochrome P450 [Pseudophaeobacter sp.]|uniref:cytochrome P450/oxidoreductase n=1 Tax=Pseudophaeobacter sp. TaxID=1971739 RepID=UPI003299E607
MYKKTCDIRKRILSMATTAPSYDVDFYSDDFIRDPHPHYEKMRALGPVVYLPRHDNYALPRYAEVAAALRNHEQFCSGNGVAADEFGCEYLQGNTVASDPPRHTALRGAMAPPLFPGALEKIRPRVIKVATDLIDDLIKRDVFDTPTDLSRHLPFTIVRDMVGLPDHGQDQMQKWAAAAFDVLGCQNERGKAAVKIIEESRRFIEGNVNRDSVRPGSWTSRILDLVDAGDLDPALAPFAMRDYINPSLDSTISATSGLIWQLSQHPEEWQRLRDNPVLVRNAVNEAVRLTSPARSFTRQSTSDVEIAGVIIPAGSRIQMMWGSANRDERAFDNPDKFDITRDPKAHLGFGSGIHMCVGMHLAQLEMMTLIEAMIPRIARIECDTPEVALNNTIYSYSSLKTRFVAEKESRPDIVVETPEQRNELRQMRVSARAQAATDILEFTLEPTDGQPLPVAEPGAHIDLFIRDGLVRQYSLTGEMSEGTYRIAVQLEPESRGGSRAIFDTAQVGREIMVGGPRNGFPLATHSGPVHLFSGGIGLTPIYSMALAMHHAGHDFVWHLSARNRSRAAFLDEIMALPFADKICLRFDDETSDQPDLAGVIAQLKPSDNIYLCGPLGYMDFVVSMAKQAGLKDEHIHLEHFGAEIDSTGDPFEVYLAKSDKTLHVAPTDTILDALNNVGIPVSTACQNGVCGSCLTTVLEGQPDHRDLVQTDAEKAKNDRITVCCSRSKTKLLILDL